MPLIKKIQTDNMHCLTQEMSLKETFGVQLNCNMFKNYRFNCSSGLRTLVDLRSYVDFATALSATSVGVRTALD